MSFSLPLVQSSSTSLSSPSSSSPPPVIPSDRLRADCPFPSPFGYERDFAYDLFGADPRCKLEKRMQRWSAAIREQKEWRDRRFDEAVVAEWKRTAPTGLTPAAVDYVLDELQFYATVGEEEREYWGGVEMSSVDGVWQSRLSPFTPHQLQSLISFVHRSPPPLPLSHRSLQVGEGHKADEVEVLDPFLNSFVADRTSVVTTRLPLSEALQSMGLGFPLTRQQYRGLVSALRTAVVPNLHHPQQRFGFPPMDPTSSQTTADDPPLSEAFPLSSGEELTVAEDEASIAARERQKGKICLTVLFAKGEEIARELRVYTYPTSTIADVKADLLSRPLVDWTTFDLQVRPPYTDNQSLIECSLHERSTAYQQLGFVAWRKKDLPPPSTSTQPRRFLIQMCNDRGVHFTTLAMNMDSSVGDVLQALHDGKGTGEWRSIAMKVPLDEQRLQMGYKWMYPHRQLRDYLEVNSPLDLTRNEYCVMLQWSRKKRGREMETGPVTDSEKEDETVEVEVEVEAEAMDPYDLSDAVSVDMQVDSYGDVRVTVTAVAGSARRWLFFLDVTLEQKVKAFKGRVAQSISQRSCSYVERDNSMGHRLFLRCEGEEKRVEGERTLAESGVVAFSRFIVRRVKRDVAVALPTTAEAVNPAQPAPLDLSTSDTYAFPPATVPASVEGSPGVSVGDNAFALSQLLGLEAQFSSSQPPLPSPMMAPQAFGGWDSQVQVRVVLGAIDSQPIQFRLPPHSTIADLKRRIEKGWKTTTNATAARVKGVPIEKQRLQFRGRPNKDLLDDRPLSWYASNGAFLDLQWEQRMEGEVEGEEGKEEKGADGVDNQTEELMELQCRISVDGGMSQRSSSFIVIDVRPSDAIEQIKKTLETAMSQYLDFHVDVRQLSLHLTSPIDPQLDQLRGPQVEEERKEAAEADEEEKGEEEVKEGKKEVVAEMEDTRTLASYGILSTTCIYADISSLTLFVGIHPTTTTFPLFCSVQTSIGDIKRIIAGLPNGFPVEWQCLRIHNSLRSDLIPLNDNSCFHQLFVESTAELEVRVFRRQNPCSLQVDGSEVSVAEGGECLTIVVKTETNDLFPMRVLLSEPISCLKWRISMKDGTPIHAQQRLYFYTEDVLTIPLSAHRSSLTADTVSEDHSTLPLVPSGSLVQMKEDAGQVIGSYPVKHGQVVRMDTADVYITVSMTDGDLIPFCYAASDRISFMKEEIAEVWKIPVSHQHIRLCSLTHTKVDDDATMQETGMRVKDAKSGVVRVFVLKRETERSQHDSDQAHVLSDPEAVQVQVRLAALPLKVLPLILLQTEKLFELLEFLCITFGSQLRSIDPHRRWGVDVLIIECGGVKWTNPESRIRDCRVEPNAVLTIHIIQGRTLRPPLLEEDEKVEEMEEEKAGLEDEVKEEVEDPSQGIGDIAGAEAAGWTVDFYKGWTEDKTGDEEEEGEDEDEEDEREMGEEEEEDEDDREDLGFVRLAEMPPFLASSTYAWLPTDFHVNSDGSVRALSYINNLHPIDSSDVLCTLEAVLSSAIPLFERLLTSLRHQRLQRVPVGRWYDSLDREKVKAVLQAERKAKKEEVEAAKMEKEEKVGGDEPSPSEEGAEDEDEFFEEELREVRGRMAMEWHDSRPIFMPEAIPFCPPSPPPTIVRLRGRQVQVIVRVLHTNIPPEGEVVDTTTSSTSSSLSSNVWQVDGQRNECIVCSAVMCVEEENVHPSSISFRQAICEPSTLADMRGLKLIYGLSESSLMVENMGEVTLELGRCVAYPNAAQHRITCPVLMDPSKGGHRTVLLLHLVDPTQRVLSTQHIPPQQPQWWDVQFDQHAAAPFIPIIQLQQLVSLYAQPTLSEEEAEKHREKAMKERAAFQTKATQLMYQRPVQY